MGNTVAETQSEKREAWMTCGKGGSRQIKESMVKQT